MRLLLLLLTSVATLFAQTPSEEISRLNPTELRARAQRGDPEAQWRLASVLRSTNFPGYKQDFGESLKWMRKSHEQGFLPATMGVGDAYLQGWAVPRDPSSALKFYREAATKGFAPAQAMLGRLFLTGVNVNPNKSEGMKWMNLAISQREISAALNLAYFTENGLYGFKKDKVQAAVYYTVAGEFGAMGGPASRQAALLLEMSPEQKAEVVSRTKALLATVKPAKPVMPAR